MNRILSAIVLVACASQANSEIVGGQTIRHIIVPANSEQVVAIQVSSTLPLCEANRVKFQKGDKAVLALLLAAQAAGKTVAFYYEPNGTTLGGITGHGVGKCELINVWVDN